VRIDNGLVRRILTNPAVLPSAGFAVIAHRAPLVPATEQA
jgi:hypothetical protein